MPFLFTILLALSPFQIDEVEVTARRAQVQSEAFRLVAQVHSDEIADLPATTISDILAYLPGIDVRSRGTSDIQTDISLRGGTFDQVLVLLNGVPISDAQTGHYTMNIPLSPALIERIEILQGTAANLTGAFSGAINIITRDATQDRYTAQIAAGTSAYVAPVIAGSWVCGETHLNASARYTRSDGYYAPEPNEKERIALENTGFQLADIYLQTRWRGLDVQAGAQYKDAGLGTGYGYASTDQFDATRTMFVSARYETSFTGHWSMMTQASYRGQHDRYEWHRGTVTNRHWTHSTQASFHVRYASPIGRSSLGVEAKNDFIRSSNMGEHHRTQASLSAEQQFLWRGLAASIGIAGHYNTWCGWYASGAANIGYNFARTGSVCLAASRALRMPTWTDLFYNAGVQRGSSDLKAEKAWLLSLGSRYTWLGDQAGTLFLSGELYYRWGQDIIDWTFNEADGLFYSTNQHFVNAFGLEFVAQYKLNNWLRNVSVCYAFTDLSLDLKQAKSQYLDYLRHKVVCSLTHGIYVWSKGCFGATCVLRWQQREGTYVDIYGTPGNAFRPVLLVDGALFVQIPLLRISIDGNNLTNRQYYDYGGILQPGINGKITCSFTL